MPTITSCIIQMSKSAILTPIQSGTFSSAVIGIRKLRLNKKEAYNYLRGHVIHPDHFILSPTLDSDLTDLQYRVLQFHLPLQKVYRTKNLTEHTYCYAFRFAP